MFQSWNGGDEAAKPKRKAAARKKPAAAKKPAAVKKPAKAKKKATRSGVKRRKAA